MNKIFLILLLSSLSLFGAVTITNSRVTWSGPSLYDIDAYYANPAAYPQGNIFVSYTAQDHTNGTYTRNTNCWAYPIDLTPLVVAVRSPGGDWSGQTKPTLISPLHVLGAGHAMVNGRTNRFVTRDNVVVDRTIIAISNYYGIGPDIAVGLLDSPVTNCGFARFIDTNDFAGKLLISNFFVKAVPVFTHNQGGSAWINMLHSQPPGVFYYSYVSAQQPGTNILYGAYPTITNRYYFHPTGAENQEGSGVTGGDSVHALCLVVSNQLVIVSSYTGYSSGYSYVGYRYLIDSMMTALGGGYQTVTCPLPSYTPSLYNIKP